MEQTQFSLAEEKLGKLMRKYAVPCIISLLVGALYNIVDQIFIANADYLGSYGNAANTVVFPLTVIALAVSVCIGDGCCAMVSALLGEGRSDKARRAFGNAILITVIVSAVLTAVYLIFSDSLVTMFGARVNQETYELSKEYFFWITLGLPSYMFGQAMNPVIRADGSPRFAMATTLLGAVLNMILDPVFIFVFKWGMTGAAAATVLGQLATAVLAVWYLTRLKTVKLDKGSFTLKKKVLGRIVSLGLCSFLSQISLVAAMAAINNMVRKYGAMDAVFGMEQYAQIPMAVVGIVMKFFQIVISIVVGMAAGCIPVVGFNMGAKRPDRVRRLFTLLLICEATVGAAALVIVECFPHALIGIFGAANESAYYTDFAVKAFRVYLCMMVFTSNNTIASEYEYDYDGEDPDEEDDFFAETENGKGTNDGDEDDDRPKRKKEKDEEVRVDPYRFLRKACPVEKATIPGCNMNDTMQRHIENYLAEKKEMSLNYFLSVSEPLINLEVSAFEVRYHVMGCFEDLKSAYLNGIMKALQKYDVKKEKVFFDYAKQYGKTEMHEFVRTSYCRHSVPSKYQYKRLRDMMRFYREYGSRFDAETIKKIAQAAEIPPEKALKYLLAGDRNNRFVDYYNMGPDPDEEDAYYSCEDLVGAYSWDPETVFFATMRADAVMEAYDSLTYREKEMVAMDLSFCSECLQPEMITNKKGEREPKPLHANSYVSIAEEFEMEDGNWAKHIINGAYDKMRKCLTASDSFDIGVC